MNVVIIDYGSGNLRSAAKAFERAARESETGAAILVSSDPEALARADRIVLPGVGAFGDCRRGLAALDGMIAALNEQVIGRGKPFLGICVGMQLMAARGLEHGVHEGLGWIAGDVVAITPHNGLKVPHMGWNELAIDAPDHPLLRDVANGDHAYFVHSYALSAQDRAEVLAHTDYGGTFPAIVGRDNMVGTQFHPEKSQATGIRLIGNFLKWQP
ncbi:MAG: imidazole glycerol phosphate synthase subunit HisH [Alphaproteobacteria bacterium]|nr:imidazole glycerol phosphate synthase subunit HisH [Alphaproteobacteria bacterium]